MFAYDDSQRSMQEFKRNDEKSDNFPSAHEGSLIPIGSITGTMLATAMIDKILRVWVWLAIFTHTHIHPLTLKRRCFMNQNLGMTISHWYKIISCLVARGLVYRAFWMFIKQCNHSCSHSCQSKSILIENFFTSHFLKRMLVDEWLKYYTQAHLFSVKNSGISHLIKNTNASFHTGQSKNLCQPYSNQCLIVEDTQVSISRLKAWIRKNKHNHVCRKHNRRQETMENKFEQLVAALNISPLSIEILYQITLFLKLPTEELLSLCASQSLESLLALQQWAWQLLSQDSQKWINEHSYRELFYTLTFFNKKLIFNNDAIDFDTRASLLFSVTVDQIDNIFTQIEQSAGDNDPFINIMSLWFNNHCCFLFDQLGYDTLPIIDHIGQYIVHKYIIKFIRGVGMGCVCVV